MKWEKSFGDKYTKRNTPDATGRIKYFKKWLPKGAKTVLELAPNKGHNMKAIQSLGYKVKGLEVNPTAVKLAQKDGLDVKQGNILENGWPASDVILCSGILMHINPIDLGGLFNMIDKSPAKTLIMIEHKEDSIRTINTRWYKNAMWVMNTGKEFTDRHNWKIKKQGWVNGKKPKDLDYTKPLDNVFHSCDYYWVIERK